MARTRTAEQRRQEIQANAARLGIDEAYISLLVETFYSRIHAHETLGSIFSRIIGDDWSTHLALMKNFWSSVALNSGRYDGKPLEVHQRLAEIERHHFGLWLELFEETLRDTAQSAETVQYFMERAHRIAQSLQIALFEVPSLRRSAAAGMRTSPL